MRLIHLTDPHLTEPPDWRTLFGRSHFGKRFLGYASWAKNRRHRMRREWLDELQAEVHSRRPDQILLTGDLTQTGTVEEIDAASHWLKALGSPDEVCLVPGNHDTYARDSWRNLLGTWGGYLPVAGPDAFPFVRRIGDVALFGLSSAVPTPPLSASGLVGEGQLARLRAALDTHADALRLLLLHHPPLPGMIKFRKRLRDAPALERTLGANPVDLMLYGHHHRNLHTERLGAQIFCTASAATRDGTFRQFDITSDGSGWQVRHALVGRSAPGQFEALETSEWRVSGRG